ncbi:activating transcription factor 7-interacting protein 1-like isoform X2 [Ischnura elegans]|uniref:activating transcription factor 7-interacting protein 1-like isoform X2 n=1 Tax=Ischnura elegans TaxID=197161 RepID=UPI001ED86C88|nr:activating transcription factor 7-interacting protein 1-like isoform X2 [Ischnura elegans]
MVTTSNQQDGASSSSPPNPPSQVEQRPPPAETSNQVSHSSPTGLAAEAPSPLRDGPSSGTPSNPPSQPEQTPTPAGNSSQASLSSPSEPANDATPLKHPAPLPERPRVASDPSWKRRPPKFSILIYNVPIGVVLSWNAQITPNHEEIKKYELFWYKEGNAPPSTSLWQKIRDVDALPLPMACSISQLLGGHTYHFAIRAVDVHGRYGKFSKTKSLYIEENKLADELRVMAPEKIKVEEGASAASEKDSNCEAMDSSQAKDGESLVSEGKDLEEKTAGLPSDSVTPVKEVEKTVGCVKESEMAVGQSKEQDKDVAQGREQDKAKGQAKEQEKEMVQVKEEKERSPCSC